MKLYGLIGKSISHSFSKAFFDAKFKKEGLNDCFYNNFPMENLSGFREFIKKNPELIGLNVTIPFKEEIISFLDFLDKTASEVGAVNTIKIIRKDSKIVLKGFNTDVIGFKESLVPLINQNVRSALILGSGGASKAVKYVLKELKIDVLIVSRQEKKSDFLNYDDLDEKIIQENLLIVNTTPLGTFPEIKCSPSIPYSLITEKHILYDLVYNPAETTFLKKGSEQGARTKNGLEMLEEQARASWGLWNKD